MKFTPEQVIEMAREASAWYALVGPHVDADLNRLSLFATLAADRALEAAAQKCDQVYSYASSNPSAKCAMDIRAMKEQQ